MQEKTLLKIALICAIIGIVVLFFISEIIKVEEKQISEIKKESEDEFVKIIGNVNKIRNYNNTMIIEVIKPETIDVVVFKNKNDISLKKGDYIEVIGKTSKYKDEIEIIGDRIRVIK